MAHMALSELVGKKLRVGYEGSYYDCVILAVDSALGWIKLHNTEQEDPGPTWYSLDKIDYICDP